LTDLILSATLKIALANLSESKAIFNLPLALPYLWKSWAF